MLLLQDIPLSDILSVHSSDSSNLLLPLDRDQDNNPPTTSSSDKCPSPPQPHTPSSSNSSASNSSAQNQQNEQPKHAFEIETVKLTFCVGQLDAQDNEEAGVGTKYSQAWEMAIRQALMPVTPQSSFPLPVSCANVASGRSTRDDSNSKYSSSIPFASCIFKIRKIIEARSDKSVFP